MQERRRSEDFRAASTPRRWLPYLLGLAALAVSSLVACKHGADDGDRSETKGQATKGAPDRAAAPKLGDSEPSTPSAIPTAWTVHGSIGEGIETHARLDATRGGKVTGRYLYAKRGRWLELQGEIKAGRIALTERDDTRHITGKIEGKLLPRGGVDGTWQSPDGKRSLALRWRAYDTIDPNAPFEIVKVANKGKTKAGPDHEACEYDLAVPVIVGAFSPMKEDGVNALLDDPNWRVDAACDGPSSAQTSFDVHRNHGRIVSLSIVRYAEGGTMMKGSVWRDVYTFARPSGRRLFLSDFVKVTAKGPRTDLRRALASRLRPAYREMDADVDEFLDAMVDPKFAVGVTDKALVFYDTNVVPHVIMGDRDFAIPFKDVSAALGSTELGRSLAPAR